MKKLFCLLFALILITGCSVQKNEEGVNVVRVGVWGTPEEMEIMNNVISEWEKTHPGIKIRLDHTNYPNYTNKILTQIAGGAAPDVICLEVDMFVNFVKKGVLEPLNDFMANDTSFDIGDFFPKVIERFTVNDLLYSIPRDTAPFACVYYNKALFDKAGVPYPTDDWDWNDMLDKAKKLTIPGQGNLMEQYGFYSWAWQNFVFSNGGQVVNDVDNPTTCLLDTPLALEGLKFYADLVNVHKVMPAPTAMSSIGMGIHSMFVAGKIAMFNSGIWETPILRKKTEVMAQKGERFDWDVVMFPKGPNGSRGFGTGGSGYAITKTSKNKKEAWEVIKALTGSDAQILLAKTGLAQPANKKIADGEFWAQSKEMPLNKKMLNEAVNYVTYNPFDMNWAKALQLYITPKLELVFNGKLDVKEAVSLFIKNVNDLLQEEN